MSRKLVSRPNLDHLRQQAKALLADLRKSDASAIAIVRDHHPAASKMTDAEIAIANFRLADAQLAIARQTGFASWPKLAVHVETLRGLEGIWSFQSLEVSGQTIGHEMLATSRILIDGDRFRSESVGSVYEGIFVIDVEPRVPTIDIHFVEGPEAGNTNFGIFKLNADRLDICLDIYGKDRPRKFATTRGTGQAYESLLRKTAERPTNVTGGSALRNEENFPAPSEEEFKYVEGDMMARVQGNWKAVKLVSDGNPVPASMTATGTRIAKQNRLVVSFGGQKMIDALFRIDETRSPIEVDYLHTSGGLKGKLQLGIISWDHETLVVNMAAPSRPRPSDFECKPGSMQTVSHWRVEG